MEILYDGKKTYEPLFFILTILAGVTMFFALVTITVFLCVVSKDNAWPIVEAVGVVYGGLVTIFIMCLTLRVWANRALSHKQVALRIDADGIRLFPENKNSRVLVSFIGWRDVTDVKFASNAGHNTIAIVLKNPMALIQHQNSAMVRRILQTQLEQSGSPVLLHTNQYEIAPDELLQKLQKQLKNFNKNKRSKK